MSGVYVTTAESHGLGGWFDSEWWESVSWESDCARLADSSSVWVLRRVWISDQAWAAATDEDENVDVWNADCVLLRSRVVGGELW